MSTSRSTRSKGSEPNRFNASRPPLAVSTVHPSRSNRRRRTSRFSSMSSTTSTRPAMLGPSIWRSPSLGNCADGRWPGSAGSGNCVRRFAASRTFVTSPANTSSAFAVSDSRSPVVSAMICCCGAPNDCRRSSNSSAVMDSRVGSNVSLIDARTLRAASSVASRAPRGST